MAMELLLELEEIVLARDISRYGAPAKDQLKIQIATGEFPKPIRLSERRIGWLRRELVEWQQKRIAARDRGDEPKRASPAQRIKRERL
jgi:hypothetical protein